MARNATIQPIIRPFDLILTPPGSKSLTNRALVISALADGVSDLSNVLFADDTLVMMECLTKLGFHLHVEHENHFVRVHGRAGKIDRSGAELFCGNSGTTMRFLAAMCTLGQGSFGLDGVPRMRQRPIGALLEMLANLGGRFEYLMQEGFPPLRVLADGLAGGMVRAPAAQSSQFLSALLMVAPYARHEVRIDLDSPQTSWPYVAMTMQLMDHFHLTPELTRDPRTGQPKAIVVPGGVYKATDYAIEPDASNASYFLAAAAIHPGAKVTIEGLGRRSLQGDVGFADVLHRMGAMLVFGKDFITMTGVEKLEGIDVDLSDMPDMAQTLAAIAIFAEGSTTIRGLHSLRVKETDRIAALCRELAKLGATTELHDHDLTIRPSAKLQPAMIETYNDHRMAMSFAVVGTKLAGVTIRNSECVEKTYPGFFKDFEKLQGTN